ncbi:MAG: MerR family transcriptional regulator [Lachnospiraceae bacterium]|nr:MerR family transcriptional regulator [Lachnospiraceae bacterium]MDY5102029.1 MerR family transcriptional regulator [Agathobacter sp.]
MKIKYVEELVGITKKNIRFYEEQGLLAPDRAENGYREYGQADVDRLMQIKLLRKLGVPIEEIKRIFQGSIHLDDCLDRHLDELERQKENLAKMQAISEQIIASHVTLQNLDTENYLNQVESMEKEGKSFMDVEKTDRRRKKLMGAIIPGIVMILILAASIAAIAWMNTIEKIPVIVNIILLGLPAIVIICIVAAIIGRMKEIKGGEEDEASKY